MAARQDKPASWMILISTPMREERDVPVQILRLFISISREWMRSFSKARTKSSLENGGTQSVHGRERTLGRLALLISIVF